MEKTKSAIIIGAGLGGLATAIRLARQGWKVKVLEKNTRVGGKLDGHGDKGFLWDIGPSVIQMPFILRELFDFAGHDLEDYLDLAAIDPITRYFYPDGKTLNTWSNFHHFQIEIARQEKDHGEALEGFMRYAQGLYDSLSEPRLFPPTEAMAKFKDASLKRFLRYPQSLFSRKYSSVVEQYFKSPKARQLFLSYAAFHGNSPLSAPAEFSILPYLEAQSGGWYVKGGMYRLAEAMEKCARDLGVEILLDAEVTRIELREPGGFKRPSVTGITLRGGIPMECSAIICNADYLHVWSRLIQCKIQPSHFKKFERRTHTASSFLMLWGLKKKYDQLGHHNLLFPENYPAEFKEIFDQRSLPTNPSLRLTVSSRTDPTQAPAGQDNLIARMDVPSLEPDHDWEKLKEVCKRTVFSQLEKFGLEGLQQEILYEKILTPKDLASHSNTYRGASHGLLSEGKSMDSQQPHRSAEIQGLYFTGSTAKPGGGIPFAFLSAQWVCLALNEDL